MNAPLREPARPQADFAPPISESPPPREASESIPSGPSKTATGRRWPSLASLKIPLMAAGTAVVVAGAGYAFVTGGRHQSTDDAYVQAAGVDISSNIAGRVIEIDVKENQNVKAGQVLFRLDPAPHDIAIAENVAKVTEARQEIMTDLAAYRQRVADLANATDADAFADRERAREQELVGAGAVSKTEFEQADRLANNDRLQISAAQQQVASALAALGGRSDLPVDAHATVQGAQAVLARARLEKSWTVIRAPEDGRVTKVDQLQVGDYINASAPVFHLVTGAPWIAANFKENQLTHMRVGQSAGVSLDAYKDHHCEGRVQSIAPASDPTFSIMPPQNATGNWVKVVQRLPVRIAFTCSPALDPAAGLSALVNVDTRYRRF
jgi:membrane fusion protein (multidrug efflux system)